MWLQVFKLLILRSPFLEKVSMDGPNNREVVEILKDRHSWFEELVNSVGVKFSYFIMERLDLMLLNLDSSTLNDRYMGLDSDEDFDLNDFLSFADA